jgi:uncharacterized membrane protein (DUF2068 family)
VKKTPRYDAIGLRLIVAYKIVKAIVELLVGAVLLFVDSARLAEGLGTLAEEIRRHVTEAWSIALAERLMHASAGHHVFVLVTALTIDGTVTLIEGWALHRRYRWSGWLVVAATALFLPFEGVMVIRHPSAGHVVLLLVNALIVLYLLERRALLSTNRKCLSAPE